MTPIHLRTSAARRRRLRSACWATAGVLLAAGLSLYGALAYALFTSDGDPHLPLHAATLLTLAAGLGASAAAVRLTCPSGCGQHSPR